MDGNRGKTCIGGRRLTLHPLLDLVPAYLLARREMTHVIWRERCRHSHGGEKGVGKHGLVLTTCSNSGQLPSGSPRAPDVT
jgi:hypothetical protein